MAEGSKLIDVALVAPTSAEATSQRESTRYERVVVGLLFLSTLINFLDRQTFSIVAPLLRDEFSLSNVDYSRIVFAFLLGYTISQIFAGKLIDRLGTRAGMLLCVAAWSVAAMLHSLALGFLSFCLVRLLLGIAEAGNWPGAVKAISESFPPQRCALAIGAFHSGSFIGALIAPPVVVALVRFSGWRMMFVAVGATGIVWIWLWIRFYRKKLSSPLQAPIQTQRCSTPITAYLRRKAVWGLMIGRCLADPVWWFYVFWLPEYLARSRGFALSTIGSTLWIPFVFAALGSGAGGYASGVLMRRCGDPVVARKVVIVFGATLMLFGIPAFLAQNSTAAVTFICVVLFGYSMWAANILTLTADLFPSEQVAQITGLVGTAGAVGGMLFTLATGWLVQNVSYKPVFALTAAMIICAAVSVVWLVPRRDSDCQHSLTLS